MKLTNRELLEARAILMREIEAMRIKTSEPLSEEDVKREVKQRARIGSMIRGKVWRDIRRAARPIKNPMLPGEITLKQYIDDRVAKEGITKGALFNQLIRSNYEGIPIRRVNKRVVFVQMEPERKEG